MDWPQLISGLQRRKLSHTQIAALCGCGQATIADLARRATSEPRYGLGRSLVQLSHASNAEIQRRLMVLRPAEASIQSILRTRELRSVSMSLAVVDEVEGLNFGGGFDHVAAQRMRGSALDDGRNPSDASVPHADSQGPVETDGCSD